MAERGAPRSESKINMIGGGNHSLIHSEDGGSAVRNLRHSPSQKSKIFASPLSEGAKGGCTAKASL